MIIPQHYCSFVITLRCKGIDVGRLTYSRIENVVQRNLSGAARTYALPGHQACHPEDIDHWLIHSVRRECAKAFKIFLIFKLERPRHHGDQVNLVPVPKGEEALDSCSRIDRIEWTIPISIRRVH